MFSSVLSLFCVFCFFSLSLSVYLFFFPLSASCPSLTLFLFLFLLSRPPLPTPPNEAQSRQDAILLHMQTDLSRSQISLYCRTEPNLFQAFSLIETQRTREGGREEYKVWRGLTEAGPQRGGREQREGEGERKKGRKEKVRRPTCVYRNLQSGSERWRRSFTNWPGLSVPKWSLHVFHTLSVKSTNRIDTQADTHTSYFFFLLLRAAKRLSGYRLLFFPPALQCRSWHLVAWC